MKSYLSRSFSTLPNAAETQALLESIYDSKVGIAPTKADRDLVLYGAGNMGRMALDYFNFLGIPVKGVVDRRASEIGRDDFWSGIPAITPEDAPENLKKEALLVICVATSPYVPLAEELKKNGWLNTRPFYDVAESYRDRHPLSNGWYAPPISDSDKKNIGDALNRWSDDCSRAHHLRFLAWRRLREEWTFADAPIIADNRFFLPEIKKALREDEEFLDAGAHVGQVLHRFIAETGGRFRRIVAIEPDSINRAELLASLETVPERNRIEVLPLVVGAENSNCRFYEGLGYPSQRSAFGNVEHPMAAIDSLSLSPSIIKLHLEGWELDALKGATETIKRHRPIIMATSYHNALGLAEMPLWFMDNLEGFKFLMRQHTWCGTGTVIYAIPEERV